MSRHRSYATRRATRPGHYDRTVRTTPTLFLDPEESSWIARRDMACLSEDPELFFPVEERGKGRSQKLVRLRTAQAKAVCCRCPVIEECLQWALDTRQRSGVWGGLSEDELAKLLRQRDSQGDRR